MITKSEQVLEFEMEMAGVPRPILFLATTEPPRSELRLNRELWEELGCPETITITFVPGDRLNP